MKAIIPAAGFGTRFLPLTKAQPKEMLPVVNKPTIQWVVEEAVEAGINEIAIITGKHKKAIENHFSPLHELEIALKNAGKVEELKEVRKINGLANISFIIQEEQKGLGHAILCAEKFVGDDPFAVLLGDTICSGKPNCTRELVTLFNAKQSSVFSVEEVKREETKRYGIIAGETVSKNLIKVNSLVEKPNPDLAPSLLGIQGRYVFTPDLFKYLNKTGIGSGGEIQLTDAMNSLCQVQEMHAWIFKGKRYDIGTMLDWFQSHIELSFNSDYSSVLKGILKKL